MVQTVNVMIGKIQSLAASGWLCGEASLQLQWSRTGHTGSEGSNTYRQIHQKATHCHKLTSTHTLFLCCPQNRSLTCGIFSQLPKLESHSCVVSFWLRLGWYDPNFGVTGGLTEKTLNTCKLDRDALNLDLKCSMWKTKLHIHTQLVSLTHFTQKPGGVSL